MKHIILLLPVVILFSVTCVKGQGCSDAGFCTINALKPDGPGLNAIDLYNQVKLGISNGRADHDINIWSGYLEYNRIINSWFSVDARLTYLAQNGPLASSSGLSDIYLNANYTGYKHIFFYGRRQVTVEQREQNEGWPAPAYGLPDQPGHNRSCAGHWPSNRKAGTGPCAAAAFITERKCLPFNRPPGGFRFFRVSLYQ